MTVLVRPQVGQITKACGVHFEKTAIEACTSLVESVQTGFGQDVDIESTRSKRDKEFIDLVQDMYGVMDIVPVLKKAEIYSRIPGGSSRPEEVVAGVVASLCSTIRREGVTSFHYEVIATRELASKSAAGRVCLFAAESYSSTIRYKGYRSIYEGAPFDVYTNLVKWFYHGA
jgi:hypothetical protein